MKTSQSAYGNTDGATTFWGYKDATKLTCTAMPDYNITNDGTQGRKLFYEARGYTVTDCYNQSTDNKAAGGFSFAQFKAEIDAGRPVMLNLAGHTIVGVGYDNSQNLIYIHDTWDYNNHTMIWGTSYSGMELLSVSIVNLLVSSSNYTLTVTKAGTGNGTVSGGGSYAAGATVTLTATPDANSTFAGWSPSPCASSFTMPANNLTCTATFDLSGANQPDLVVTSVTSPSSGVAGGQITVGMTVTNQGTQLTQSFWAIFYLSLDTTITPSDINTGWGCPISPLAAGASYTCGGSISIPASVESGTYYLGGYADPGNTVGESNEANNGRSATNPITITGGGGPTTYTLTLTKTGSGSGTVSGGGSYAAGATVTLTATPDAGTTFAGWSPSPCAPSFTMPASNLTCTATFNAISSSSLLLAGLTTNGQIYYTSNLATWTQIAGQLNRLQIVDLDQDGQNDLVGLASNGSIWYTTNLNTWASVPGSLSQLVVGNFDSSETWADLAGIAGNGSIWYTTNLSTWTNIPGSLSQIVVGDFNGDGRSDLAGLASNGSIWYTTNLSTWINIPGVLNRLVAGDFNGDGRSDLAGLASNGSIWYTTNLSTWTQIPGALNQLVVGDLNGDGQTDLAGLASSGTIWYTTNLNNWTQIPGALDQLRAFNLNGDGKADLAGLASNGTIWYTTNLSAWTQIPGQLQQIAGDGKGM